MKIKELWNQLWDVPVNGPKAAVLLRLMAGSVFVWEGVMKFIFVTQGVGRFTKLGFPFPGETAHFVAVIEIIGGLLLLAGLGTRLVAFIFVGEMAVAILSTKITLFLGTYPLALLAEGPGRLSLDAWLKGRSLSARSAHRRPRPRLIRSPPPGGLLSALTGFSFD